MRQYFRYGNQEWSTDEHGSVTWNPPANISNNNSMNQTKPPQGSVIVKIGTIEPGDLLWDSVDGWEPAASGEIERPVTSFHAVARPINHTASLGLKAKT